MSAAARGALVTCVVFAVTYLAGAFSQLSFDITQWSSDARSIVATVGCLMGTTTGILCFAAAKDCDR